jgi:Domain of unknown function (DUF1877)
MSVLCSLKQVSTDLLQKIIETPALLELFENVIPIDSEEEKIENIHELSPEYVQLLEEIWLAPEQAIGQLTLWDLEEVDHWRGNYPEEYQLLKSEIYSIMIEGKTAPVLELGQSWDALGYIFRGRALYSSTQSCLVEGMGRDTTVEVILGGKHLNEWTRYLESIQIREIATALFHISEEVIRHRFEQGRNANPNLYRYNWSEDAYASCLKCCLELKNFYLDAAYQTKGILINLG